MNEQSLINQLIKEYQAKNDTIKELENKIAELEQKLENNFSNVTTMVNYDELKDTFNTLLSEFDYYDIATQLQDNVEVNTSNYGLTIELEVELGEYHIESSLKEIAEKVFENAIEQYKNHIDSVKEREGED